jgi:hypothetical protein
MAPHEVPALPTDDELNDPGDLELFLLGGQGRRPPPRAKEEPAPAPEASAERAMVGRRRGPSGELGFIR